MSHYDFAKALLLEAWFADNEHLDPLIDDTVAIFEDRLQIELFKLLPEDNRDSFTKLTDDDRTTDAQTYDFLKAHIADLDNQMAALYERFAQTYKDKTIEHSKQ